MEERESDSWLSRLSRGRSRTALVGTAVLGLVVVVLLVAPGTQASPASASPTVIAPPFPGATWVTTTSQSTEGCAHSTISTAPTYHASTGKFELAVAGGLKICPNQPFESGYASGGVSGVIPLPGGVTGNRVFVKMTFRADIASAVGPQQCILANVSYSYCQVAAQGYVEPFIYLYDETAQNFWFPSNEPALPTASSQVYDWCFGGICGSNVTGNQHFDVNVGYTADIRTGPLNASHTYELIWSVSGEAYSYTSTYNSYLSGTGARASVTMAGGALGARLAWIAVV
jgi:hypothetical protein